MSTPSDGSTRIAVPYASGAFEEWDGAPCNGSKQPECDVSSVMAGERLPTAVFRPFVVDGIKSLTFGLGYHGEAPDHFMVSLLDVQGSGFTPVPGLERLASDLGPVRISVPVHLLPWGRGAYLTEACDARGICVAANGGEGALEQSDSVAATGYFKAPVTGIFDQFGSSLSLSADGGTLAVGALQEDSSAIGVFAPGDAGYQAALDDNGTYIAYFDSGAAYVYHRSDAGHWALEAFVKAPNAEAGDRFGASLALSADGRTLAVTAPYEDGAHRGAFAPSDPGWQAALDSNAAQASGAAYVYGRSDAGRWSVKAYVKAPNAETRDQLGWLLALSGDGGTLVVEASGDDSTSIGVFAPGDAGYQAALDSNETRSARLDSGAAYVYHRSDAGHWALEAFVKAPKISYDDRFDTALALSFNGDVMVVGGSHVAGSVGGSFLPTDAGYRAALDNIYRGGSLILESGAVYTYSRSVSNQWKLDALVKAPDPGSHDHFGSAVALSADGDVMAVGASWEHSVRAGVFAPSDPGYHDALGNNDVARAGAVYTYHRSDAGRWTLEAYIKAHNPNYADRFGERIALSSDGVHLAVAARLEDSASTGTFARGASGYRDALGDNSAYQSGAVYAYHRSDAGRWTAGNFVKASNAGDLDYFGSALALSGDGATLAVGAPDEAAWWWPNLNEDYFVDLETSYGAVYLY